ncbi:MAG: protein kinase, partial [Candidatus Zixiibacteriota bacterium]
MMKPDNDKTQAHVALTKGTMVGHYRIVEKIGAGGMGEVHLAEDTELDRRVALKFLPPHLCQDEDCRTRFKREAQAAARLNHPNIVTIHEVAEYQGRPYIAMEHVEGRSLRDYVKDKMLALDQIVDLAIQICEGLRVAHEKKIVHRDIKPSNIIIDADRRPRILDFGLASVQGEEHLTRTGSTLGTVSYMSPEQAQGRDVDHRSDLFSFGVVLYELITGHSPFARENDMATGQAIIHDTPEPMARYRTDVTPGMQSIVDKALDKDVETRYQTAAGISADLKREKKESVSTATPVPSPPPPSVRRKSRVPGIVAGILAAAVIVTLAIVAFWPEEQAVVDSGRKTLAVLPFENLGSPEDEYFADGITDEITARLAGIAALRVTSRTSTKTYKDTDKPVRVIGEELGVDYLLEGTIRWDKSGDTDRVRIIPQLIRVSDDSHVWANTFERALIQVFVVQAEIAGEIAEALGVTLLEPDRSMLMAQPTQNLEAYDFFLRGIRYWDDRIDVWRAVDMLERAVQADPGFYQAHAKLAQFYGFCYINELGGTYDLPDRARRAAEATARLAPGSPETHLAMGYFHYYISRDYEQALDQFERALRRQRNNSDLLAAIGYVQRRQGKWEESLESQRKAFELDPRNIVIFYGLGQTLYYMHRYREVEVLLDEAARWVPDAHAVRIWQVDVALRVGRDTSEVRVALHELERYAERPAYEYWGELAL